MRNIASPLGRMVEEIVGHQLPSKLIYAGSLDAFRRRIRSPDNPSCCYRADARLLRSSATHHRPVSRWRVYLSSQTSSMRQPLKMLLTMIVYPLT